MGVCDICWRRGWPKAAFLEIDCQSGALGQIWRKAQRGGQAAMNLESYWNENPPAVCPEGWSELDFITYNYNYRRICQGAGSIIYFEDDTQYPTVCPIGWIEADMKRLISLGGNSIFRRTCYQ